MARIRTTDEALVVELTGLRPLWALKRRIVVPWQHVRGATVDPGAFAEPKGIRAPGLHVPGYAAIGTFRRKGERTFWEVRDQQRAVVVELTGEPYARLVLEVADPRGTVDAINAAAAAVR